MPRMTATFSVNTLKWASKKVARSAPLKISLFWST